MSAATKGFDRASLRKALSEGVEQLSLDLSDTQIERLIDYLALLTKWNGVYNLTAIRDPMQMVTQHLLDSLTVVSAFANATRVLDVGAGGGLPGLVLAIWAEEKRPEMQLSMVDTVHKKTAFLQQVKTELVLKNVSVYTARVEELQVQKNFDVITSRAFAELVDFVTWSSHLLLDGGQFIAMKGVVPHDEIARLPAGWCAREIRPLSVPGLQAERHLIFIERSNA